MTDTEHTIRVVTRNDLLSLPAVMLGFEPEESLVMLHLLGNGVEFCTRVDADVLIDSPEHLLAQILSAGASPARVDGRWVLMLYSHTPLDYVRAVEELAFQMGGAPMVVATDSVRSWDVVAGLLLDELPFDPSVSPVTADAVWRAVPLGRTREEVVAELGEWDPCPECVEHARDVVPGLDPGSRLALLATFLEEDDRDEPETALLAGLLGEEECFAEVLARMSVPTAPALRDVLVEARTQAPPECLPNVTALLALACWLSGEGALTSECLVELDELEQGHPLGAMIRTMQQLAIPPSRWDED
ncbi:DUF4192 family protein [Tessaracoccus oleiagri]|uniref:DUF4192 domain-containing protein n=1 Tax=Tessaracoccus oleiagri TaxID=686624 RepID=A0A1G9LR67_9ACTN|nr:DUF4192 family protein [Tessaracoccus oleiagri]SDL64446.1 protein of unknown function [Tessaracoccus oleiagri]